MWSLCRFLENPLRTILLLKQSTRSLVSKTLRHCIALRISQPKHTGDIEWLYQTVRLTAALGPPDSTVAHFGLGALTGCGRWPLCRPVLQTILTNSSQRYLLRTRDQPGSAMTMPKACSRWRPGLNYWTLTCTVSSTIGQLAHWHQLAQEAEATDWRLVSFFSQYRRWNMNRTLGFLDLES